MARAKDSLEIEFEIVHAVLNQGESYGLWQARICVAMAAYPDHPLWEDGALWDAPRGVDEVERA